MKTSFRIIGIMALAFFTIVNAEAQTTNKKPATTQKSKGKSSKSTTKPAVATIYGKEIKVTLKNLAEGTVPIFAGPKEDLKNTAKRKTVGGLGTNTLYVRVNEIVCILNGEKTVSCVSIKENTTSLEINSSANTITTK